MALALVCAGLVIFLIVMKSGDNTQHESDAAAINDFSNQLDTAQSQLALFAGRSLMFSNRLEEARTAALTLSNQWLDAQAALARTTEQVTSLNRQVAAAAAENQTLGRSIVDLTNQMTSQVAALTKQTALAETALNQANTNYALLENRLRRDVAERLVIQRKFYNRAELQAQLDRLQNDPFVPQISEHSIYAGLDVEVRSNSFHVISPN